MMVLIFADNKLGALKHKQMEDNKNQRSETTRQVNGLVADCYDFRSL